MKAKVSIILLVIILIPGLMLSVINLSGNKRHVIVQLRHDQGAIIINAKKVRVPYTMQETAILTQTDGMIDFLFLDDYKICLVTSLTQLLMGLLLIFIYYVNTVESWRREYRPIALKILYLTIPAFVFSELISNYVFRDWIIDTKNGINGNAGLFGNNATFLNMDPGSLNLDYRPNVGLFIIPVIATVVILLDAKNRENKLVNYNLDGETP